MPSYISPLSKVPLLRFLLPTVFGILLADTFQNRLFLYITLSLALLLGLLWLLFRSPSYPYRRNILPLLVGQLLFVSLGQMALLRQDRRAADRASIQAARLVATLCADAEPTDYYVRCKVTLLHGKSTIGETYPLSGKAILYMAIDSAALSLKRGDVVACRGQLAPIVNAPNPDSFDYAGYMRRCGYTLSQHLESDEWYAPSAKGDVSLIDRAYLARSSLLQLLDSCDLEPPQRALLTSLLLGYRDDITHEQQEAFATAGLSHVLAVSGLHTAVVLFLLFLLLSPLSLLGAKRLQILLVIPLLWGYAYLVGLPPSVVRVAIITTSLLFGRLIGRRYSALNALCLAAFAMLLYDVNQLFLVGFQLSFVATLSILLLQSLFRAMLPIKYFVVRYLWSLFTVTLAAQIGTLPLVLYYFHTLPLWSLLTNMLVVPLLPFIIGGGFLLLLLLLLQLPCPWLVWMLHVGVGWIDGIAAYVKCSPHSSIENIYLSPQQALLCFVALALLYLALRYKKVSYLLFTIIGVALYLVWNTYIVPPSIREKGVVIYHNSHYTAIQLLEEEANYMVLADSLSSVAEIERCSYPFRLKNHLSAPIYITDTVRTKNIWVELP